MSSTIFNKRLQTLKQRQNYHETAIQKIEKISSENGGKLPKKFNLEDLGIATITKLLNDLGYTNFVIKAPNGSASSVREIIFHKSL